MYGLRSGQGRVCQAFRMGADPTSSSGWLRMELRVSVFTVSLSHHSLDGPHTLPLLGRVRVQVQMRLRVQVRVWVRGWVRVGVGVRVWVHVGLWVRGQVHVGVRVWVQVRVRGVWECRCRCV